MEVESNYMEVIALPSYKRRAMILSANMVLAIILLIALIGLSAGGLIAVNQWKASTAATQARALDSKLLRYSEAHQTVRGQEINALYMNIFGDDHHRSRPEFPAAITGNGVITEHDRSNMGKQDSEYGYMTLETDFTDNPKAEPYKFHYIPRTYDGSEWSPSMGSEPITHYTLEYYTKSMLGKLEHHVSPNSYENIKDADIQK